MHNARFKASYQLDSTSISSAIDRCPRAGRPHTDHPFPIERAMAVDGACFVYGVALLLAAGIAAHGGWMKRRRQQRQEGYVPKGISKRLIDTSIPNPTPFMTTQPVAFGLPLI